MGEVHHPLEKPICDEDLGQDAHALNMLDQVAKIQQLKCGKEDGLLDVSDQC